MYIARQPIFDVNKNIYGYELFFRKNFNDKVYTGDDNIQATSVVLEGLLEVGLDKAVNNLKAFVNFDYNFLNSDLIKLVDSKTLVVEVLEDTTIDKRVLKNLEKLSNEGYTIALDDFSDEISSPFVSVANIIKYDILLTPLKEIKKEVKDALKNHKTLLAEKVETEEDYIAAKNMGFELFQGFFFSKPEIVGHIKGKPNYAVCMKILQELDNANPSVRRILDSIRSDATLMYRFLRIAKKAGVQNELRSIEDYIRQLGVEKLKYLFAIILLQKNPEYDKDLITTSFVRSKFGEKIAENSRFKSRAYEISIMGLFSVLDKMYGTTMEEILNDISVSSDTRKALLHNKGELVAILGIVKNYKNTDAEKIAAVSEYIGVEYVLLKKLLKDVMAELKSNFDG